MKKMFGGVIFLFMLTPAFSQQGEGKITYEQKINVHKRMPPEAEQFKAMVPEFQTNIMELYFTPTSSLYRTAKTQADQLPSTTDGGGMRTFRFGGADNAEVFRDYENETMVESRELGPKRYLIDDSLRPLKWKLEEETMQVAGYTCRKATTTVQGFGMGGGMMRGGAPGGGQGQGARQGSRDSVGGRQGGRDSMIARMMNQKQQVVAWYTEEIPSAAGPADYFGLPGLILYLDIDEGTIVFSPKKLEPLGNEVVKAPTKGNKITRKEYFDMMRAQAQSMGGRPGGPGGGTFIIRQ